MALWRLPRPDFRRLAETAKTEPVLIRVLKGDRRSDVVSGANRTDRSNLAERSGWYGSQNESALPSERAVQKVRPAPVLVLWVPPVVMARTATLAYAIPGSGRRQTRRESFQMHTPCTSTHPAAAQAL